MKKRDTYLQYIFNLLVIVTGLLLGWFKYFAIPSDPYSSASSPWQVISYNAHIISAPFLVFGIGLIWHHHIWPRWKRGSVQEFGRQKIHSGQILFILILPMILSGYILQTTADEFLRKKILVPLHLVSSAIWIFAFILHLFRRKPLKTVYIP